MVFVSGASNSGTSWAPLVAQLKECRCLVLDRPGTGLSDPLPAPLEDPAALEHYADAFLDVVLDALNLDSAHVVSTSYGGYLALRSSAATPDRVDRIVHLGWTVGAPTAKLPTIMRLAGARGLGRLLTRLPANERVVRSMFRQIGLRRALETGRVSEEMIDWFLAQLRYTDTMRNEIEVSPWLMSARKGMDERILLAPSTLAAITAPSYFLWGEDDLYGGADIARDFTANIAQAELELLPGGGHAVWIDNPDHTAKTVAAFLGRADGR